MVSLKMQKRLAASVLNCGHRKVWLVRDVAPHLVCHGTERPRSVLTPLLLVQVWLDPNEVGVAAATNLLLYSVPAAHMVLSAYESALLVATSARAQTEMCMAT